MKCASMMVIKLHLATANPRWIHVTAIGEIVRNECHLLPLFDPVQVLATSFFMVNQLVVQELAEPGKIPGS